MKTLPFIWVNGKFTPWKNAQTHFLTHTLHYGGGAFEGIRFYKTPEGSAVFRLKEHLERLAYSSSSLAMTMPYNQNQLVEIIKKLIIKNKISEGYIRPMIYYGYGKMGLSPLGAPVDTAIAIWPMKAYLGENPVKAFISTYMRVHPKSTDIKAKLCGTYVNSIFASLEAHNKGYDEAILLDYQGHVAEGPGENIFIIKKGKLLTPKLGTILAGITRNAVFALAKDLKIPLKETIITKAVLLSAEEAFYTGTAAEISPIASINGRKIGTGKIGPYTQKLKTYYSDVVHGKIPRYYQWLTYV